MTQSTTISPYKVAVIVEFNKGGKIYKHLDFITDMDQLEKTLCFRRELKVINQKHKKSLHKDIIRLSKSYSIDNQYLYEILINYLCCFETPNKVLKEHSLESNGFGMIINADDESNTNVFATNYEFLLKLRDSIIKNN